jgi:integrase
LRKTFATHYLAETGDLYGLMKIGGWKDIKTLQAYVGLTDETVTKRADRVREVVSSWFADKDNNNQSNIYKMKSVANGVASPLQQII